VEWTGITVIDIENHLRKVVGELRRESADKIGRVTQNPFTGRMDYVLPDPFPPGVTIDLLEAFKRRIGVAMPGDLKTWLTITNGAAGFFGLALEGENWSIDGMWESEPHWRKNEWFPVGSDGAGNYYLRVGEHGVCFVEGTSTETLRYAVASDILHFANFAIDERLRLSLPDDGRPYSERFPWPFVRAFVTATDPDILKVTCAPMPWDYTRQTNE
jgi:hypothetical protein